MLLRAAARHAKPTAGRIYLTPLRHTPPSPTRCRMNPSGGNSGATAPNANPEAPSRRHCGMARCDTQTVGASMAHSPNSYRGFRGKVGRTRAESEPYWDPPLRPAQGAPNVVIVFMDDLGWSDVGCYGSEIATPNIDALAGRGLRFNHYTTHPICSPARAALLTGMNAHSVATGWLANNNPGFPGYSGEIPLDAPTHRRDAAGRRATPRPPSASGTTHPTARTPIASWPTHRGFDRFYGFLEGETSYFYPARILANNVRGADRRVPGRLLRHRRLDGEGDRLRHRDPQSGCDAAVLPLRRQQCRAWAAAGQGTGPRQIPRPLRCGLGCDPRRALRTPEGARHRARRCHAVRARSRGAGLGRRCPTIRSASSCATWKPTPRFSIAPTRTSAGSSRISRAMGELDNTIFVFSSDNGGTSSAGPTGMVHFNRRFAGLPPRTVEDDMPHGRPGRHGRRCQRSIRWAGDRSRTRRSRPTRPTPVAADGASPSSSRGRRS